MPITKGDKVSARDFTDMIVIAVFGEYVDVLIPSRTGTHYRRWKENELTLL